MTGIWYILNFSMNTVRYIKSFSKGQITIPKEIRKTIGVGDDFWLKIYIDENKLVAEPVGEPKDKSRYLEALLKINGSWFSLKDFKKIRGAIEKKLKVNGAAS